MEWSLLYFSSEYRSLRRETRMHAWASLEENGVGLGLRRRFSHESINRVISRSSASICWTVEGLVHVERESRCWMRWRIRCRSKPSYRLAMYWLHFLRLVLDRDRWDGATREESGDRKDWLISMSKKIGRWSEDMMELNGSIAPRFIAGRNDWLQKM